MARYGVVPKVAVNLRLATGGIDEAPDQVELAGLMADMLVEGTTTRSAADISRLAAEMGGSLTAGAGDDQINIGGEVLSESADRYIAMLADVVLHPRFAEEDVALEISFFSSTRLAPCRFTSLVRLTSRLIIERFAMSCASWRNQLRTY